MHGQRFLKPQQLNALIVENTIEPLLDRFDRFSHQPVFKWIDRDLTALES
jgi:hypothetical protein